MKNRKQIIVIGAGPGGLAAAIQLASAGFQVKILEKMATPGGRTSALTEGGFRFDLGPTFFLYPQILDEILRSAGTNLENEVDMIRLDPQYRIQFGAGGSIDATPDPERMRSQIAAIHQGDAGGFDRFMADNREKFRSIRGCLEKPFLGWGSLLAKEVVASLPYIRPWESVDGYLRKFFSDERVRLAFSFQSKYLGMSPFRCPSLFSILSYLEYDYGVWHPVGGCAAVSEAMARVAQRMGVEIRYREPVTSLVFEGRRVAGVRTTHGAYRADAVVTNADFAHAMRTLVPDQLRRRWTDAQIETKQFSCSTFMLYLGIDGDFPHMPHHTIQISPNYRENLREIEDKKTIPTEPSFYVQNACATDPSLAPKGRSTLYILAPVPHQSDKVDWKKSAPAFREKLLSRVEKAGFEGVRDRICYEKQVTPDDWEGKYSIHKGATFNLAHSLTQMLHWRPRNRFEDIEGMYLVGGGTHPGSGLPVIYEGARITSRLVCEDFGITLPGPQDQAIAGDPFAANSESASPDWQVAARVASGACPGAV